MTQPEMTIRPARKADRRAIAELFLIASDGLAAYIWEQSAEPGESLLDTGARRYGQDEGNWSYHNCLIAEVDGQVAGMAHAFAIARPSGPESRADPVLRPYAELEDPGSYYLSAIALHPAYRGRGFGRRLLEAVLAEAGARGLPRVSLICFEQNVVAIALYDSLGFVEGGRRANQSRKVWCAKAGRSRSGWIPPSRLNAVPMPGAFRTVFTSRGIREASLDHQ